MEHGGSISRLDHEAANNAALDRARRKAYWRLLPLLFVCYVIAYVDRTNVAIAKLTMARDLPGFDNAVFGFGMGLAGPGYAGGTTLRVGPQEQGSIAGLVAAAPGLGFVIGPLLGAWLYAASPHWPYLAAAVVYLLLAVWVWRQKNA